MISTRTVFVTGAGQGLGAAIAAAFYRDGANVALSDVSDHIVENARQLDPSGTRTATFSLDVRSRVDFQRAFDECVERFGRVDVLVNNAARTDMRTVWEVGTDEWDDVIAVNLRGTLFGCQIAGLHMRGNRFGRIINLSSLAGQQSFQNDDGIIQLRTDFHLPRFQRALSMIDKRPHRNPLHQLRHIHDLGVWHCDIKPSNLLWTDDGVKLIDFGIAKTADSSEGHTYTSARYSPPDLDQVPANATGYTA